MVYIFASKVNNLPDPAENPAIMEGLPQERIEKILRKKGISGRKQSLGAGLLLKYAMSKLGKENIIYNLSHSGDMVICAASPKPVGCDIEEIKEAPLTVATRFFSKNEEEYVLSLGEGKNEEFYRIWTIKEAYSKMCLKGISMGFRTFTAVLGDEVKIEKDNVIQPCKVREYNIPGYKMAVCSEDSEFAEDVEWVEIADKI